MMLACVIVNCNILRKRSMEMTKCGYISKMVAAIIIFIAFICILYVSYFTVKATSLLREENLYWVCTESYEIEDFSTCSYHDFSCSCLTDISLCADNYPIRDSSEIHCVDWRYAEKYSYDIFKPPKINNDMCTTKDTRLITVCPTLF